MDKENIKVWGGCLLWIIGFVLLVKGCDWYNSYQKEKAHLAYLEKKQNDSIRKAFIADSLSHDPHYQDSIRIEKERYDKWLKEREEINKQEIVGFILSGDSVYHSSFHPLYHTNRHSYGLMTNQLQDVRFVTASEVLEENLRPCLECDDKDLYYQQHEDGELIHIDDIEDYVKYHSEDFEDLFEPY